MCRSLSCGLMLLLAIPVLGQAQPIAPDVLQTYEARKALLRDPVLGPLNLGVKVTNRVAVLWGPVPSTETAMRAVSLLEKLPGLVAVKDELDIDPDLNLPLYLPETLPQESRLRNKPADAPLSSATLTTRSLEKISAKEQKIAGATPQGFPPVAVPPTTIPGMPDHREIDIVLPSLRIPTTEPETPKTPAEAIAALQQDSRFARIQVRLDAGLVTLSADADQAPLLYELARRISAIAGIDRVVVQEK